MRRFKNAVAVIICLTLGALIPAGVSVADEPEPSPSLTVAEEAPTIADIFPEGLPEGALMVDADTIAFDGGMESCQRPAHSFARSGARPEAQ